MGSNSKSSAAQQDNYYGTLAGAVCIGPVAELVAVILGGKYWYKPSSPLLRSSANASGYSEIVDTRAGARTGKLRFYWGTETQATDPVLIALQGANNVPPYAGVCYFVLIDFFFGTSFGSAPNLEFIVRRAPNQAVVDGAAAALDSNQQANPVAMAAEVATAWHGLDLASAVVDADSLQDLADEIQGNAARRALVNCSPLWTSQAAARSLLLDLGATGDLWFRLGSTNLVEAGRWRESGPAGEVTTLDANALAEELALDAPAVDELPTGVSVDFSDRAYAYADSSDKVDELALLRQQGRPTVKKLKRVQVTSRTQARAQAAAELRRIGRVVLRGSAKVRRARAVTPEGLPIRPGDWFKLDVDTEPGGAGVAMLCRCTGRIAGPTGPVTLEWETDPDAVPEAYQPDYEITEPESAAIAPLEFFRLLSIPEEDDEQPPRVSVLAVRPDDTWERVEVLYSDEAAGDYVSLGSQLGFACPATIVEPLDFDADVVRLALVATFAGAGGSVDGTLDADLLREAVGSGTDLAARNDELLLVLVRKDGADIAASGNLDWAEVCSIIDVTPVSAGVYDVKIIRARMGTRALDFGTAGGTISFPSTWDDYEAWCLPRSRLARLSHADFAGMLFSQEPGYYRFGPATAVATYDPAEAEAAGLQPDTDWRPQVAYVFPAGGAKAPRITLTSPAMSAQIPTSGAMSLDVTVEDGQDDLLEVSIFSVLEATGANYTEYLKRLMPMTGSFAHTASVTVPNVEGLHRVVVQARDLRGRVVQREALVFRFVTGVTPVPPAEIVSARTIYVQWSGFGVTAGYKNQLTITLPAGIDYVAVPHTLQMRKRASNGTYPGWSTFAPNTALFGDPGVNFFISEGQTWQFRVRRDGDGVASEVTTLSYQRPLVGGGGSLSP